jgi:MoaA/NifB/PqqE/SkfB family radical SAM enzyme
MANISITNKCNRNCVYCFAGDSRESLGKTAMDFDTYLYALNYLERSGLKQVRLLGGEPTLHPLFRDMVSTALERDLDIMLFTNGLVSEPISSFLGSVPRNKLAILLNTIHPLENDIQGTSRQKTFMKKFGRSTIAGVNIYSGEQELDYLIDYVNEFGLKKEIRLGLSHTVQSGGNTYLHPKQYSTTGIKIARLKTRALKYGISLGFDCGFVPCMFPYDSLQSLSEELKKAGNCCHPVIDFLTDGTFISCYPLNNFLKIRAGDDLDAKKLTAIFENKLDVFRGSGIYAHCSSCPLFGSRCNGGCMSYRINRYELQELPGEQICLSEAEPS